jgi:hypothetical protein
VNQDELRAQLEGDLAWRLDELRHLRNTLLGTVERSEWPVSALRTILVMQYSHLEGFAHNAFKLYVDAVNAQRLRADELRPHLFATALVPEFDALRLGGNEQESNEGRLTRRANMQFRFVEKLRTLSVGEIIIDADHAISMEMNFGADVLKRTLFMLGIPVTEVDSGYFISLEFVRRARNDIAHGSRRERIEPSLFEAHRSKCEQFMNDLVRLISAAMRQEWYRPAAVGS